MPLRRDYRPRQQRSGQVAPLLLLTVLPFNFVAGVAISSDVGNVHACPADKVNPDGSCGSKVKIVPSMGYVVDNFLTTEEVEYAKKMLSLSIEKGAYKNSSFGSMQVSECHIKGGSSVASLGVPCLEAEKEGADASGLNVSSLAQRVLRFANQNLIPSGTLTGAHAWKGEVFLDHSILRHYPAKKTVVDGNSTTMVGQSGSVHTDSDFDGRCLSAVLFLGDKEESDEGSEEAIGDLKVFKCKAGRERICHDLQGEKLRSHLEAEPDFWDQKNWEEVQSIEPKAGRVAYFLSETPHSVGSLKVRPRDALLTWMTCSEIRPQDISTRRAALPPFFAPFGDWANNVTTIQAVVNTIATGNIVRVLGAAVPSVADSLGLDLLEVKNWEHEVYAGEQLQWSRHVLRCPNGYAGIKSIDHHACPRILGHFHRWMNKTLAFWSGLAGRPLSRWSGLGPKAPAATLYQAGDFLSPHTDLERGCALSVIWHLTPGWEAKRGGHFWWSFETGSKMEMPSWNTMYIFKPSDKSVHHVSPVMQSGNRFAVSGCFYPQ
mmetsp:Transcript_28910/g.61571  ORF Transcript_28910/g.61571 Transcript_28910/m.61571 type:complete len:545 (-) Transcript_28910:63-1697(-)